MQDISHLPAFFAYVSHCLLSNCRLMRELKNPARVPLLVAMVEVVHIPSTKCLPVTGVKLDRFFLIHLDDTFIFLDSCVQF